MTKKYKILFLYSLLIHIKSNQPFAFFFIEKQILWIGKKIVYITYKIIPKLLLVDKTNYKIRYFYSNEIYPPLKLFYLKKLFRGTNFNNKLYIICLKNYKISIYPYEKENFSWKNKWWQNLTKLKLLKYSLQYLLTRNIEISYPYEMYSSFMKLVQKSMFKK